MIRIGLQPNRSTSRPHIGPVIMSTTMVFTNRVINTGPGADTFEITYTAAAYPSGTSLQLFQSDANTPLLDSDNDGVPDTGVLQPGATNNIILKVTLPAGATNSVPYIAYKTATSHFNSSVSAVATDEVATLYLAAVDLTANTAWSPTALGKGIGPEATAVVTNTSLPGTVSRFTLYVNNTGPQLDTYNLSVTNALPTGWSVDFKNSANTSILNTGPIAGGTNSVLVYADVTIPALAGAGTNELFFQVCRRLRPARMSCMPNKSSARCMRSRLRRIKTARSQRVASSSTPTKSATKGMSRKR